jgi:hypothetical protein
MRAGVSLGGIEVGGSPALTRVTGEERVDEDMAGTGREERDVLPLPLEELVPALSR